jgi:hypothetical protein
MSTVEEGCDETLGELSALSSGPSMLRALRPLSWGLAAYANDLCPCS